MKSEILIQKILNAFASVEPPSYWCIINRCEGVEPDMVINDFNNKTNWQNISSDFLDRSQDGLVSALSFFSDEAFRFYLPAYMIADIKHELKRVNVVCHLTRGLTEGAEHKYINPRRYGNRTWRDEALYRFSVFNPEQVSAIIGYLRYKLNEGDSEADDIEQSLKNCCLNDY